MSVILVTCAIALFFMCAAYMVFEYYSYRNSLLNNVSTLGSVIASNSAGALAFDSPKDANEILGALRAEPHITEACLYNKEGKIFASYPPGLLKADLPPAPLKKGYHFETGYLEGFQPIMQEDKMLGTLYLKSDLESMYAQLRHYALIAVLLILGTLVIASLFSRVLQKSVSEPILALEETAKVISEQRDYSVRAQKYGSDEVGALTEAFNQMLAQIQSQNHEILLFNQNLEQKVKDRTLDLQQQKDFVETVINSSVDLIAVFDKNLNYLILNKRSDEYYTLKREHVIGKNILDVYPHVIESGMFRDLKKALNGEYIHDSKYKSSVANKYFSNYYIPLKDAEGNIYGVMAIAHDITQIMEATEKLETLNAELLKSNRDLEQFAYVASHDLQEPLRKIQTFTDLMSESFHDKEKLKKYHDKINQSASRMQGLIQDVLNFSRISKAEEAFENTDLDRILKTIETDFELIIREKGAVINHSALPTVKGIPLQLSQLFSNIIGNALKYNERKPEIQISSRKLTEVEIKNHERLNGHSSYFELKFADNGIGFEPKFKEQIFNVFQRLHGRQEYSGTGIGLALCKKIVENHNGIIYAEAEPEKGAVFTIILPG